MELDMRHSKLKAEEVAILAGEVEKPSWASRNEGIHERVSFEDTIWGFELAGGIYYKTPLRVVYVKPGSRAEQACIKLGDTVLRINDIDTATLTLQEAHKLILESGIHLRIAVTSPDDDIDAYYSYCDPTARNEKIPDDVLKALEAERIRRLIAKAARNNNLQWPWVRRKMIIYRESNCFLVPSKYEGKHKEQFPDLPHIRYTDDITEICNVRNKLEADQKEQKEKDVAQLKLEEEAKQHQNSEVSDNEAADQNVDEEFEKLVEDLSENVDNVSENGLVDNVDHEEGTNELDAEVDEEEGTNELNVEAVDEDKMVDVKLEENEESQVEEQSVESLKQKEKDEEQSADYEEEKVENIEGTTDTQDTVVSESVEESSAYSEVKLESNEVQIESSEVEESITEQTIESNEEQVIVQSTSDEREEEETEKEESMKIEDEKIVDGIISENGQYEEIMESLNER